MRRALVSISLIVLWLAAGAADAAEKRPFTVHDLVAMARIADPQPSPDGSMAAFTVTTMDLEANKGRSDLWLAALDGSGARRLTTHEASDSSVVWRGNGSLYFLSSRTGSSQVWRLPTGGGEAEQVTRLPLDVEAFQVAPTGDALYVAMAVFPDCAEPVPCTVERVAAEEARKSSGRIYDRLFVRHWDSWEDGRRNHVFRIPLGPDGLVTGEPRDLMPGVDADCPTTPFGDTSDWTVSPDGDWLVYTAKVVAGSRRRGPPT
jgi:dipeptidyl aminopeptidase/acylaminoacyl peptidase